MAVVAHGCNGRPSEVQDGQIKPPIEEIEINRLVSPDRLPEQLNSLDGASIATQDFQPGASRDGLGRRWAQAVPGPPQDGPGRRTVQAVRGRPGLSDGLGRRTAQAVERQPGTLDSLGRPGVDLGRRTAWDVRGSS